LDPWVAVLDPWVESFDQWVELVNSESIVVPNSNHQPIADTSEAPSPSGPLTKIIGFRADPLDILPTPLVD